MAKKTEIKVYLPAHLVGQLETRRKAGVRSKFIQTAIQKLLDKDLNYEIEDEDFQTIIDHAVYRLRGLKNRNAELFAVELGIMLRRIFK